MKNIGIQPYAKSCKKMNISIRCYDLWSRFLTCSSIDGQSSLSCVPALEMRTSTLVQASEATQSSHRILARPALLTLKIRLTAASDLAPMSMSSWNPNSKVGFFWFLLDSFSYRNHVLVKKAFEGSPLTRKKDCSECRIYLCSVERVAGFLETR